MHDDSLLYQAAELYFVQDMTMGAVAERLGVSRSTVSRRATPDRSPTMSDASPIRSVAP